MAADDAAATLSMIDAIPPATFVLVVAWAGLGGVEPGEGGTVTGATGDAKPGLPSGALLGPGRNFAPQLVPRSEQLT